MSINPFLLPTSSAGRMKANEASLRQHDTDIQRLWNQLIALANSQGWPVTGDPTADPSWPNAYAAPSTGGGGGGGQILFAVTTADYTRSGSFNRDTNQGTVTATPKIPDPSGTPGTPWPKTDDPGGAITIVIMSDVPTIKSGTWIEYQDVLMPDGTTVEHQYLGGDC